MSDYDRMKDIEAEGQRAAIHHCIYMDKPCPRSCGMRGPCKAYDADATRGALRGQHDDAIEALGKDALDNPVVNRAVQCALYGSMSWGEAMIVAVRALAAQNKELTDRIMRIAAVTPFPTSIVITDQQPLSDRGSRG
jgi:hypothetical protein